MSTKPETPKQAARRLASAVIKGKWRSEALHEYRAADGTPLYWKIRVRLADGKKWLRPMHANGEGFELSEPKFPGAKPLYRLDELAAQPTAPAWYAEGENCADTLATLGVLATTAGSATNDEGADFTSLAGRTVTIWPDNDRPGVGQAQRIAQRLAAVGCTVELIDAAALGVPEGGDVVDWLQAHPDATAADLARLPRARIDDAAPITKPRLRWRANGEHVAIASAELGDDRASHIVHRRAADVTPQPIRWLWPGRIARGKITVLAGHPGLGKSQVAASMAAIVSTGGAWPVDHARCERGSVIIASAEDDAEDTIRPRLEAAGADLTRVHIVDAVADGYRMDGSESRRGFRLDIDIARLAVLMQRIGHVALVVIDPITAFLGEADSHKNAEVRALLAPLADMAALHGAAIVCVSHLTKNGDADALMRVMGSLAFVAAARAAYVVARDRDDEGRRLFLPLKNNLGVDRSGLAFRVEGAAIADGIETSRVVWESEAVTVTADEAMAPQPHGEERSALQDAMEFLRSLLADGPVPKRQIDRDANGAGYASATIRRAQKALSIEAFRDGFGKGSAWKWQLPKMLNKTEDALHGTVSTFAQDEHLRGQNPDSEVI